MCLAANSRDVPGDPEGVVQTSVRVQAFRGVLWNCQFEKTRSGHAAIEDTDANKSKHRYLKLCVIRRKWLIARPGRASKRGLCRHRRIILRTYAADVFLLFFYALRSESFGSCACTAGRFAGKWIWRKVDEIGRDWAAAQPRAQIAMNFACCCCCCCCWCGATQEICTAQEPASSKMMMGRNCLSKFASTHQRTISWQHVQQICQHEQNKKVSRFYVFWFCPMQK